MGIKGVDQFIDDTLVNADGTFMELKSGDRLWYSQKLEKVYFTYNSPWREFLIITAKCPWPRGKDETYYVDWWKKNRETGEEELTTKGSKITIRDLNARFVLKEED